MTKHSHIDCCVVNLDCESFEIWQEYAPVVDKDYHEEIFLNTNLDNLKCKGISCYPISHISDS